MAPAHELVKMHHAGGIGVTEPDTTVEFEPVRLIVGSALGNAGHCEFVTRGVAWCMDQIPMELFAMI